MKILKILGKILGQPKVLLGLFYGIKLRYCFYCLTIKELINRDFKTIIDVGANQCDFINACKFVFLSPRIIAFEPCPEWWDLCDSKVDKLYRIGLGDKDEKDKAFYYQTKGEASGSSFLEHEKKYAKESGAGVIKIKANVYRFDSLDVKITRPCLLKIDTEGFDGKVLDGFGDRLKEIDVIQVEWLFEKFFKNQMKLSEIIPLMEKYGFDGFIQETAYVRNANKMSHCDLIFFRTKQT